MVLKSRLNERTRRNIMDFKVKFFDPNDRVSNGYLIGLASEKINDFTEEVIETAVRVCAAKSGDDNVPVSITLRQDVYEKLLQFQKKIEVIDVRTIYMAEVIDILMICVNIEKYHVGNHMGFVEITEKMVNIGFDSLVFKQEYEISVEQEKEKLYEQVRCYLETDSKGIELCNSLRLKISSSIKSYSDYYNIYRYNPAKRKTLGTANIIYIAKAVTGLLLCIAETEEIKISQIINEIKQTNVDVC